MRTAIKRPLLSAEDRSRLRRMAANASRHTADGGNSNRAYAQGAIDVLAWLADNAEPTPLLEEIVR